ncbi:hypothetical protein ACF8O8_25735 [Pseudomonas sp. TYF_14]|uniref:hypothetical protein n=1 Tax=Pseudomonas sp. TYF_14 TaxID=3367193 RepID=UPI00370BD7ED
MKVVYQGQKQEHSVNDINTKVIVIGTEDVGGVEFTYVKAGTDIESVLRLFTEAKSASRHTISLVVTEENYAERYELAREFKAGLYFVGGQHLESLSGYSSLEVDEYAAQAGALKNLKRFVASVARQVPFSLTRDQAAEKVADAASTRAFEDEHSVEKAIDLLNKTIDSDVISYQHSRKINLDSQIAGRFLSCRKPGPDASAELEAYAAKIFAEGGIHVLADGMGKGKTKHVIRKLIEAGIESGEKSTVLSHRIAIARSSSIADLVEQYNDDSIEGREDQLRALSLVINKCDNERFRVHTHQSGIIIIEEAAQVLRHMMQKGFVGDRHDVFHEILGLMKKARLVLVCEAFINNVLMNYVRLAGRPISLTQGNTDYSSINVCLSSVESTQREILRSLAAKKKIIFASDSRKHAETVTRIARDQGARVLLITQNTKDNDEVLEFFANPNEAVKQYDVLCHSPSMQSSVSITVEHFDDHFCIFGGTVGVDDAKQFVRRDRTAKRVVVGIHLVTKFAVEKRDVIANFYASDDQVFDSIATQQLYLSAREKNHFQQWLSLGFELEGFTITRLPTDKAADEEASKIFKNSRKSVKETITKGTMVAGQTAINDSSVKKLEKTRNEQEYFLNNFIDTAHAVGKIFEDVNEEDVKFFSEGAGLSKLMKAKCWLLDDRRFIDLKVRDEKVKGIDCGNYVAIRNLLTNVMKKLGIGTSGEGAITHKELKSACDYIVENQLNFKLNGLISIRAEAKTERQMNSLVSDLLSSLGLSKIRKMIKGERVYVLNKELFDQIDSYVNPSSSEEHKVFLMKNLMDCDEQTAKSLLEETETEI